MLVSSQMESRLLASTSRVKTNIAKHGVAIMRCHGVPSSNVNGSLLHPVQSNLGRLAAVVRERHHLEPGVLQGLLGRDAARRVVDEDLVEQVQELLQERGALGYYVLLSVSRGPR